VEVIRRIYDRWEQERAINPDDFHSEFEMRPLFSAVEGHSYEGIRGYRAWRDDMEQFSEADRYEPEDFVDLGEHVLVTGTWFVTSKITGAPVEATHVHLWIFRDGKPWRWEIYPSKAEALEAAGLRGEDVKPAE
jgi:ketosteroid isomerase-like protein